MSSQLSESQDAALQRAAICNAGLQASGDDALQSSSDGRKNAARFTAESDAASGAALCSSSAGDSQQWQPGLVRKLFDKELDNHHEEALLLAQLAAQQLAHALQRDDCPTLQLEAVCSWADTASQVIKFSCTQFFVQYCYGLHPRG